jgi:hypothetical protein
VLAQDVRLYEIDSGDLLIDGVDVRTIDHGQLRRQIGMVPQDPFLFRGSIAANISYGNPAASPEQILLAAQNADAHDFIMRTSLAYDTQLGEGGTGSRRPVARPPVPVPCDRRDPPDSLRGKPGRLAIIAATVSIGSHAGMRTDYQ